MNNICGPTPPKNAEPGDLWFNTIDELFYYLDDANRWITVDNDDIVVNVIMHSDAIQEDPVDAYERAMGIL